MPTAFQHVEEALDVRLLVDEGMGDGVAHTRLGGEMQHHVGRLPVEDESQRVQVADVVLVQAERELDCARTLQLDAVVVVEVVEAGNVPSAPQERLRRVEADEPGRACDQ